MEVHWKARANGLGLATNVLKQKKVQLEAQNISNS